MLTGDNGILTRAAEAKEKTDDTTIRERIGLAQLAAMTNPDVKLDYEKLKIELAKEFGTEGTDWNISSKMSNPWIVTVGDVKYNITPPNGQGISATDIASKTFADDTEKKNFYEGFYGSVVTNYGKTIDTSLNDQWKIFYADGEHIYLIADSYVNYTSLPSTTVSGTEYKFVKGGTDWKACFGSSTTSNMMKVYQNGANDISDKIIGTKTITAERIKGLNNSFFNTKGLTGSEQPNMQAVASMLDVDLWKIFMDASDGTGKAEYAIGGPTVEMFMASYNQTHGTTWTAEAKSKTEDNTNADGYRCKSSTVETDTNKVYRSEINYDNADSFWLASPSVTNAGHVMHMTYEGYVTFQAYHNGGSFRPLVCLKSNVQLVKTGERQYRIVD